MAEKVVLWAVGKYFERVFVNFDSRQNLQANLFRGETELSNLQLRPEFLQEVLEQFSLPLAVQVRHGKVDQLVITANLRRLKSEPVVVKMKNVTLKVVVSPKIDQKQVQILEIKQKQLDKEISKEIDVTLLDTHVVKSFVQDFVFQKSKDSKHVDSQDTPSMCLLHGTPSISFTLLCLLTLFPF